MGDGELNCDVISMSGINMLCVCHFMYQSSLMIGMWHTKHWSKVGGCLVKEYGLNLLLELSISNLTRNIEGQSTLINNLSHDHH